MNTITCRSIFLTFFKLGSVSFGGGYAMLSMIELELVQRKQWIERDALIDLFAISESLPGAIALNTSALVGYSIKGVKGALVAILGNLTPCLIIMTLLVGIVSRYGQNPYFDQAFYGIRAVIVALILYAGIKIARSAWVSPSQILIALMAFIGVYFLHLSVVVVILMTIFLGGLVQWIKKRTHSHKEG